MLYYPREAREPFRQSNRRRPPSGLTTRARRFFCIQPHSAMPSRGSSLGRTARRHSDPVAPSCRLTRHGSRDGTSTRSEVENERCGREVDIRGRTRPSPFGDDTLAGIHHKAGAQGGTRRCANQTRRAVLTGLRADAESADSLFLQGVGPSGIPRTPQAGSAEVGKPEANSHLNRLDSAEHSQKPSRAFFHFCGASFFPVIRTCPLPDRGE